jgi:hypothetical protein
MELFKKLTTKLFSRNKNKGREIIKYWDEDLEPHRYRKTPETNPKRRNTSDGTSRRQMYMKQVVIQVPRADLGVRCRSGERGERRTAASAKQHILQDPKRQEFQRRISAKTDNQVPLEK